MRIEAPIPGKSLVGIEVPNSEIMTVSSVNCGSSLKLVSPNSLRFLLGKAVDGSARTFDLPDAPPW